jgi:hypothetical protein
MTSTALPIEGEEVAASTPSPWHVSPWVDIVAYHFSWLWILLPLTFLGERYPLDFLAVFVVAMTANFAHRHFTLAYVYLDRQVFAQYPARFILFPAVMMGLFLASPYFWNATLDPGALSIVDLAAGGAALAVLVQVVVALRRGERIESRALYGLLPLGAVFVAQTRFQDALLAAGLTPGGLWLTALAWLSVALARRSGRQDADGADLVHWMVPVVTTGAALALLLWPGSREGVWPGESLRLRLVVSTSAFLAVLWNLWHIHMQKYGILRLYNAKCVRTGADDAPWWVDRMLVFGWLPFYLVYLGPANRDLLLEHGPTIKDSTMPLIDGMEKVQPWLLPFAVALVAVSILAFLVVEWRTHRLRNLPRLSIAAGLTALSASFLVFSPAKVALAYVFTHSIEYMVFVGAFQKKRYGQPLAHRPLLARLLRRPWLAYGGFTLCLALLYAGCAYYGRYFFVDAHSPRVAGATLRQWVFFWGIYQSMVHFYFDGFLWKMRLPVYRRSI